jgi:glucose/arabinose dehydrogenase
VLFADLGRVRDVIVGSDGAVFVALNLPGRRLSDTTPGIVIRLVAER